MHLQLLYVTISTWYGNKRDCVKRWRSLFITFVQFTAWGPSLRWTKNTTAPKLVKSIQKQQVVINYTNFLHVFRLLLTNCFWLNAVEFQKFWITTRSIFCEIKIKLSASTSLYNTNTPCYVHRSLSQITLNSGTKQWRREGGEGGIRLGRHCAGGGIWRVQTLQTEKFNSLMSPNTHLVLGPHPNCQCSTTPHKAVRIHQETYSAGLTDHSPVVKLYRNIVQLLFYWQHNSMFCTIHMFQNSAQNLKILYEIWSFDSQENL